MKKVCLSFLLISMMLLTGCGKNKEPNIPKSVQIYQQLNLTAEQQEKITELRNKNKAEIQALRAEIEKERDLLLNADKNTKLTVDQKRKVVERYKNTSIEIGEKLIKQSEVYDLAFKKILTSEQQSTYDKYLKERQKEQENELKKIVKKSSAVKNEK